MMEAVAGFLAGAALGGLYFGALWVTVGRVPHVTRPGLLVAGSYLARLAALAGGLYAVVRLGGGAGLVAGLVGLLAVRRFLVRKLAPERAAAGTVEAGQIEENP